MSLSKKDIIKESFLALLEQYPLSQITVKDIVEASGVNRNTFYYHFADLPTLIESIVMDETAKIVETHQTWESIEEAVIAALDFTLQHKKAVMHLYNSNNRDIFNQYFMQISRHVITDYFDTLTQDIKISDADKELLIHYHTCLAFGLAVDWVSNGMTKDIKEQFERLCVLYKGIPEEVIKRASLN